MTAITAANESKQVKLKRRLGLISAFCFIINSIIGSGIFVTPGSILSYSGSVGLALVIWVVCGIMTLMFSLVYAELAALVPRSGCDFAFLMAGLGPLNKFWGPLAAYSYSFIMFILLKPVSVAVMVMVSVNYTFALVTRFVCFEDEAYLNWAKTMTAFIYLSVITYINATTVFFYVIVQNLLTILKIAIAFLLVGCGIYELSLGNFENIATGFEGTTLSAHNVALAIYNGAFAYGGWQYITSISEEVKRPEVNIFRGLIIAIPSVIMLYLLLNISYMTVLSKSEILSSSAVAVSFIERVVGALNPVVSIGIAVSTFGTAMTSQFSGSRIFYAAAQEGHLLRCISFIHVRRFTPVASVIIQGLISSITLFYFEVRKLIEFLLFTSWIIHSGSIVSLFILRRSMTDVPTPYRVPSEIPALLLLVNIFLFVTPLIMTPQYNYFIAFGVLAIGFVLYYIFVYKKVHLNCMDKFTYFIQVLLEVVPCTNVEELIKNKPKVEAEVKSIEKDRY